MDIEAPKSGSVYITLGNKAGEEVVMTYSPDSATIAFDRRHSGIVDFSQDFPAVTTAPILKSGKMLSLRIFVDRSSIELFADGGRSTMTNLVFPTQPYSTLSINTSAGKAKVKNLKIYSIKTK